MTRALALACFVAASGYMSNALAQSAPRMFEWAGMYSPNSGNFNQDVKTYFGFNPVPMLWRLDPMANATPSSRARNTYLFQETGATASIPTAWHAFLVYQDAAVAVGGNPIDTNDIANTLAWFENQNFVLDYAFADFEGYYPDGDWSNTFNLINQVRESSVGAATGIGNYDWFPGPINLGADYPWYADRRTASAYYPTNASNGLPGLTVAMPVGYALQSYLIHAYDTSSWGAGWWASTSLPMSLVSALTYNQQAAIGSAYLSPNERAGMFYGPLEQVSSAKRNLPAGQQLIPWVSAFQSVTGVPQLLPGQVPTAQDNEAFLEHCRLRGADGFYAFGFDGEPAYSGTYTDGTTFTVASLHAYAADMATTWKSMDWFFELPTQVGTITADGPLNLNTFKNTGGTYVDPGGRNGGIEWSAYQRGNRILAVISNLGNGAQAAAGPGAGNNGNWQSVFNALSMRLPPESPVVPAGNHLVMQFLTNPALTDFSAYGLGTVLGAAQGWHASAGDFVIKAAAGSGDGGDQVVSVANGAAVAWLANSTTANPGGIGATASDTMMYSFRVFTGWSGSGSASFAPVVGSGSGVPVPSQQNGPTLWVFTGGAQNYWGFGTNYASGGPYHSTNFPPAPNTWYEVEMIVNPATDLATIYVMNLTAGNGTWTLLQFGPESALSAGLIPAEESPSLYNGFQISGSAGAQFDQMSAQIYSYPATPLSSYSPAPAAPPDAPDNASTDAPLPLWALLTMAAGMLGIASRKLHA